MFAYIDWQSAFDLISNVPTTQISKAVSRSLHFFEYGKTLLNNSNYN